MRRRNQRRGNQRGVTLMIGTMSLIFLVPLMGLGIDVGFLFAVKSKLQAATDGASLAAARALTLGESTSSQQASAQAHAQNWFDANYPSGYFGTHNTSMATTNANCTGTVTACIYNDPNNPNLQHVTLTASTQVDTFFMKWFGYSYTTVAASSDATRRDVVAMMVLDRSGSMNLSSSCSNLISAAKLFTGQFAAGRDYIGAVSFSDGPYLHSAPSTSFQSTLGYSNDFGSATGQFDNIQCNGGTGTPAAIAWAYDQLYKMNLPGALNLIMFETDGLPNTLELNFWDSTNKIAALPSGSACLDTNNKTVKNGGFTSASIPTWTASHTMASSAYSTIPAGMVGSVYSGDPWQEAGGEYFIDMFVPYQSGYSNSTSNSSFIAGSSLGCAFATANRNAGDLENGVTSDFAWTPLSDVYGNQLNPSSNPYTGARTTCTASNCGGYQTSGSGTYLKLGSADNSTSWTNYHDAVLNATDNAGYQARTNSTLPVYIFGIGLGGNCTVGGVASMANCTVSGRTGDPPDYILMQRLANDPNGDLYNSPPYYSACSSESTCVNYSGQPQGTFIFSYDKTQLAQAFLRISSQALRLAH